MTELMTAVMALCNKHMEDITVRNGQVIPKYCPFCQGGANNKDTRTFAVNQYNGSYNCKRGGCGVKGSFADLCDFFGEARVQPISVPFAQPKKIYDRPNVNAYSPVTEAITSYFADRGISAETVAAFKLMSDEHGNIVFPFYRNEKLIFTKFRRPRPYNKEMGGSKEWSFANGEPILFGMDNTSFNKPLYITEGQIDAMSLYEAGVSNVVSVPAGVGNTEWVNLCWDWLEEFPNIILFGDNDNAGIEMVNTLTKRLGEERCMIIKSYPEHLIDGVASGRTCKDANEILVEYGAEELFKIARSAEPAPIKGVLNLSEVEYIDPLSIPRIYSRIPEMDFILGGFAQGQLTIYTGQRGNGKSTVAGQVLLNSIEQGYNVCAYSGELSASKFKDWIYMQATEAEYVAYKEDIRTGKNYAMLSPTIRQRIDSWLDGKFYLFDNKYISDESQIDTILNVFTLCAKRFECKMFLVDNMLSALCMSEEEEYKAQAKLTASLKNFAVKYDAHVILVSHPRKVKAGETLGNDDVSGTAAITNLADNVLVSEKPNQRIIKNRDFGVTGVVTCDFNPANRRIYESRTGDRTVYSWDHTGITRPEKQAISLGDFEIQRGIPDGGQPF